ncbi:hypothetical protein [Barrientosiimonas endolithica]|uniref:hypothetical protein n=1 Tax=Barrientosiimonas endolithica TaxID=1535208 RepID=UPI00259B4104|nr:hypothetical protein [Barrientosiimonas endolithica]
MAGLVLDPDPQVEHPFSATPIIAAGRCSPGNTPSTTAPPSSITSHGRTPRAASASTAASAAVPKTSSSQPKER